MGNVFAGGGRVLHLNNRATHVFVEVLILAVSDLASTPWEYRYAYTLTGCDQHMVGFGTVGFDLEDIDWGDDPRLHPARKAFIIDVIDTALAGHRWDELDYDPSGIRGFLHQYRDMVEAFTPRPGTPAHSSRFAKPEDIDGMACCLRHRVLTGMPDWLECVFCTYERTSG